MDINAAQFKAKCLKLLDQVAETRESLVITKRGKPVAKLVPIDEEPASELFGYMRGTITLVGDIISPLHEPWEADNDESEPLADIDAEQ